MPAALDAGMRPELGTELSQEPPVRPRRLLERLHDWRNRVIASPRFQAFAMAFPLTRPVARAKSRALFDICAGFVYSQVLSACIEFDVFRILKDGALSVDDLAQRLGLSRAAAERLFRAGAALDLLHMRCGDRVALGEQGAALLGNSSVFAMVRHHALLYRDLVDPVELFRKPRGSTELSAFWDYAESDAPAGAGTDAVAPYSALMAATQAFIARDVIAAYPFHRHRQLLDIGGGEGAFVFAVGAAAPDLSLSLFDLPSVAAIATARAEAGGFANRFSAHGGDFKADPLPEGADVITLVRVLHDHDDGPALALLRNVRSALPPGGRLVVAEPMAQTRGARAMGEAYFGVYLWAMGSGRPRSRDELTHMLHEAGFPRVREAATRQPVLTRVLVAE